MSIWSKQPEYYYSFAGVTIALQFQQKVLFSESRTLAPFRVAEKEDAQVFWVKEVDALPEPRGALLAEYSDMMVYGSKTETLRYVESSDGRWENAWCLMEQTQDGAMIHLRKKHGTDKIASKSVFNAVGVEHLVVNAGGVILHASYVNWDGRAILFTAPSGTGKSTQAALWHEQMGAEIINGDRAVFRMEDNTAVACGIPFAGSSGICKNKTLPLAAIVYLSQAPETTLKRLGGFSAFRRIWEGCSINTWEKTDVSRASAVIQSVLQSVPVYALACTPDETAVSILAEELRRQEKESK